MVDFLSKSKNQAQGKDHADSVQHPLEASRFSETTASSANDGSSSVDLSASTSEPIDSSITDSSTDSLRSESVISPPKSQSSSSRRPLYRCWWAWVLLALGATSGGAGIATYETYRAIESQLPDPSEIKAFAHRGTILIKGSDGSILQQIGEGTRQKIPLDQIPDKLIQAFIASEDKNFYEHTGIDYRAVVRALRANLTAGEVVEGGSTITQQVARIVFLDQERTVQRKLREATMAQKMERQLDKQTILERYLNLVYLGSGAYGVADAAWIYFGKPVQQLNLSEMAMIAGMPPAPSVYSPIVDRQAAQERRDIVLQRMAEAGYISPAEMQETIATPLKLNPKLPRNIYSRFPYFTTYVQQELTKHLKPDQIEAGGLTVETTLNPKWQSYGQQTIQSAINRYGRWEGFTQAALTAVDPRTGEIKVMVGGYDYKDTQFNRVTQAQRQPGSTFKAFVYTTAIATGASPYKSYTDEVFKVDGYEPKNFDESYRGPMSMRDALISSINIVAVQVLIDAGFNPTIAMAQRMGIRSPLIPAYSLALGSLEVNLLELTSAFGTLANKGKHVEVHGIRRVIDRYGKVIYTANLEAKPAVDETTANIMTWMLRGVVQSGTGAAASLRDRPVAGKTGTSEEKRDLWFVGYIPQMVAGVWLGNDNNKPTWGASRTAALVWRDFMRELTDEIPPAQFAELPRLSGRKGSIKAEPVKPRRIHRGGVPKKGESSAAQEGSRSSRSERRSRRSEPSRRERQSTRSSRQEAAPRRSVEPARSAPPAPAPRKEPPPAPAAPPAPPPPPPAAPEPPPPGAVTTP